MWTSLGDPKILTLKRASTDRLAKVVTFLILPMVFLRASVETLRLVR
jgi:hypothetical protein